MPDVAASCLPQVIAGNWKQRPEKCSSCQSPAELPFRYTCHTFNIPKVLFFLRMSFQNIDVLKKKKKGTVRPETHYSHVSLHCVYPLSIR